MISVFTNTAWQVLGKVATAVTTFAMTILIARSFGAEGYGEFTKITTYVALFFLFADFGLNAVYLQKGSDWRNLLGVRIVASLLLTFIAIATLSFLPQGTTHGFTGLVRLGIILYSPAIVFQALLTTANGYFQKNFRYSFSTIAITIGSIVSLVLIWIASGIFTSAAGTLASVTALLVGSVVTAIIAFSFVRKLKQMLSPVFNRAAARELLFAALPLGATLIFNVVYFRIDSLIMTVSRTTTEVGVYGLAYKFFELPLVLPTFFMNALYPLMLAPTNNKQQTTNNLQQLKKLFRTSFWFLVVGSLLMVVILWTTAPLLSFIKSDFAQSIPALRVLSLGLPFFFLTSLTMWTIIALKKQTTLVFIYGVSMVGTIIADLVFIPTFGMMAAAWITVASEGAILVISALVLVNYFKKLAIT